MASDVTALKDGEGAAVYNLGNGIMAVVTKRKGDGTYQRITRQAAQEKVQFIRVAALKKSVGALNSFCIRVITCR